MEDETGTASIMVWKKIYEAFREAVIAELLVGMISRIERDGPVVHVIAARVEDVSHVLAKQGRPVNINANDGAPTRSNVSLVAAYGLRRAIPASRRGRCFGAGIFIEGG